MADVRNDKEKQLRIAGTLRDLYGRHAPRAVAHDNRLDSWPLYSAALLARVNYCLESVICLQLREVDAGVLCRVLFEHVVTVAWLAVDPTTRLPRALKGECEHLRKADDALKKLVTGERDAKRLEQMRQYVRGVSEPEMPDLLTRAREADSYWGRLLDTFHRGRRGFEGLYTVVYRNYSLFTHPSVWASEVFVAGAGASRTIGRPQPQGDHAITMAPILFAQALLIAADRFNWPPAEEIYAAFEAEAH
jgi:hypothetical protein